MAQTNSYGQSSNGVSDESPNMLVYRKWLECVADVGLCSCAMCDVCGWVKAGFVQLTMVMTRGYDVMLGLFFPSAPPPPTDPLWCPSIHPSAPPLPTELTQRGAHLPPPTEPTQCGAHLPPSTEPTQCGAHLPPPTEPTQCGAHLPPPTEPTQCGAHLPPPTELTHRGAHLPSPTEPTQCGAHLPPPTEPTQCGAHPPPPTEPTQCGAHLPLQVMVGRTPGVKTPHIFNGSGFTLR
ncbi:hypothetical protein P4O66_011366 [Electrophorus voltai]|uniref:Uncharacterized protein n=1 Tax=Electrophorus voltai TaxID=2609070 RepID=A0AAD8ZAL6_9TELE|nr:hypothetical protein P4O66_011366 [Electrophorus voltai]